MPLIVTCPSCRKTLKTPDACAGLRGKCPCCGSIIVAPSNDATNTQLNPPPLESPSILASGPSSPVPVTETDTPAESTASTGHNWAEGNPKGCNIGCLVVAVSVLLFWGGGCCIDMIRYGKYDFKGATTKGYDAIEIGDPIGKAKKILGKNYTVEEGGLDKNTGKRAQLYLVRLEKGYKTTKYLRKCVCFHGKTLS